MARKVANVMVSPPEATEADQTGGPILLFLRDEAKSWAAVREWALARLERMLDLEPKILRGGDRRSVHDFRVASRRFQQALDLLSSSPMPAELRRLRRKIKRSRRGFSDLRNCDVLITGIEKRLARKRVARRMAWEALLEFLRERRSRAQERGIRKLIKLNLARAHVRFSEAFASQPDDRAPDTAETRQSVSGGEPASFSLRLMPELGTVWRRFSRQLALADRSPDEASIHRARIAAKRLRYLVEVMHELEIPGSQEITDWLRGLQHYLGEWHDLDVAEQMMADMMACPETIRGQPETVGEVLNLIRQGRKTRSRFCAAYPQWGGASAGYRRAEEWVRELSSAGSAEFPVSRNSAVFPNPAVKSRGVTKQLRATPNPKSQNPGHPD